MGFKVTVRLIHVVRVYTVQVFRGWLGSMYQETQSDYILSGPASPVPEIHPKEVIRHV